MQTQETEILSAKVNAMADTIDRMSRSMERGERDMPKSFSDTEEELPSLEWK